jgi:hypothetical protein
MNTLETANTPLTESGDLMPDAAALLRTYAHQFALPCNLDPANSLKSARSTC